VKSVYDIKPEEIKIEKKPWDEPEIVLLAAKEAMQFNGCLQYWTPLLERGKRLEDYYEGKILTTEARAQYRHEDKIIIEPPIAKAPIRALVGQTMKSRKSGQVVTERNTAVSPEEDKREIETINIVLKDMEVKTCEEFQITEAVSSAFVTCYWNVLLFDKQLPSRNGDGMRYKMTALPWGSCVFGPMTAKKPDGSDIKEFFYFDNRTMADLIDNFPSMKKQILAHFADDGAADNKLLASIDQWSGSWTAAERDELYNMLNSAYGAKSVEGGMVQVIQHFYPVKKKEEVWINVYDDSGETFEMRPPDWDDERWEQWQRENPHYYGPYEKESIVLWQTVFTMSGLVLSNEAHWFQENGKLPCSFWVGAVDFGKPTGPMVDMEGDVLASCVGEIEYLDDLRKGSGRLLIAREGAVTTIDSLHAEANKSFGVAFVSKDAGPMGECIQELVRRPNDHYKTYAEQRKAGMFENTRINETMMGEHAPRQSAIAKEAEISQALTVNARYVDAINRCWDCHQNLKLQLIPYLYDQHEVIEVMDEKTGEPMTAEVNAPDGYDAMGNVASVVNDLTAHRYRFKISPMDNSPTAKMRNQEEALVVINGAAGPMLQADPSGEMLAVFLQSCDNPLLRETGKRMAERSQQAQQAGTQAEQQQTMIDQTVKLAKAESELLRAQKHGMLINGRFQDLTDFPVLHEFYLAMQQHAEQRAAEKMQEIQQTVSPQQEHTQEVM
jgi:hypothetical protein